VGGRKGKTSSSSSERERKHFRELCRRERKTRESFIFVSEKKEGETKRGRFTRSRTLSEEEGGKSFMLFYEEKRKEKEAPYSTGRVLLTPSDDAHREEEGEQFN